MLITSLLRSRRGILATAAAYMLGLSATVYSAEQTLSLTEAQRLAVLRSRQLLAQDFAAVAAREMAVVASRLPDPIIKFGIENLPVEGEDRFSLTRDFMTMRRVGVMQEFTRGDKRRLRSQALTQEAEKSLIEKNQALATIQRDTALAWLDRYYAEAMVSAIGEQAVQVKFAIQAAEGAYRAGRGKLAEVFMAKNALAAIDDRTSEMQRQVIKAKQSLGRWIDVLANAPLGGKPDIKTLRYSLEGIEDQLAHHPQIAALSKQEEIALSELKLAEANLKPDWSAEVAFSQRGSAYSNMVSVGVSLPWQWDRAHRQNREVSSKLALLEKAKALREEALRAHIAEIRSLINEWENGKERLARYQNELIPLANQRTDTTVTAYRGGKSDLAEVLTARRDQIEVGIQTLQLEASVARTWAELNFLFPIEDYIHHDVPALAKEVK